MFALRKILKTVGAKAESLDHIKIIGQDPLLPSPFKIGEIGAASIAAVGHAISEYWFLQTGRRQKAEIGMQEAVVAQRAHQYSRLLDNKTSNLWDPLSGFYRTKDQRWIQLHCNFPHHRQGVVDILGCANTKEAVAHAILNNWEAEILETVISSQGLCASMVRMNSEWEQHPQAKQVAKLPPLEIIKVNDSPIERLPSSDQPLSGIKVLDLTRVIAGPVCARTLAEHGATVLHITSPKLPFIAPLVMDTGHGKFSAYLDLDLQKDRECLKELMRTADIFSQAYRPGGLNQKGFSLQELVKIRPGIIYIELSAYSHLGPWANRHGYDTLVQSATGIAHEQGTDNFPQHLPAQTLDYITGYLAAFGAIEALRRRALEGGSYHVRTSLLQIACLLNSLGRVSNYSSCKIPSNEDVAHLLVRTNTKFGRLEHLPPVLKLSETSPFWKRTTAPLGSHAAKWPEFTGTVLKK